MDYKVFLGVVSIIIALLSYYFYLRDIFNHKTKPHTFSWFIWGILMSISFFAQTSNKGGPGSWVVGFTALICFLISLIALKRGLRNIRIIDWIGLTGALLALFLWFVIKEPILSVILISITYSLGFLPTFRKSYNKPYDETLITFILNGLKFLISFFALNNISYVTAFYPITLVIINWSFVVMLIIRRKSLSN